MQLTLCLFIASLMMDSKTVAPYNTTQKNDFTEGSKILLDTDLKIISLKLQK